MAYRSEERGRGPGRGADRGRGFRGRGNPRGQGGIFSPTQTANIDARLLDNSDKTLVASLLRVERQPGELPFRPDFGTVGKPTKLRANFFPVKAPKSPIFEYDVSISPSMNTTIRRVKRRIFQLAEGTSDWLQYGLRGNVAHDHSARLIAAKKLPQPLTIRVPYTEDDEEDDSKEAKTAQKPKGEQKSKVGQKPKPVEGRKVYEYTLTIEFARNIDTLGLLNYLEGKPGYRGYDIIPVISVLNIILAAHPNRSGGGGVMVGRNRYFFPTAATAADLGGGLEAWRGFYSSIRPAHHQLMVNVNVCTTAFYKPGNLARAMIEFRSSSFGARVNAFVKGLRVKTTHLGYTKTVKSLSNLNARQYKFKYGENEVTVEDYFLERYQLSLEFADLPLVDVGGQKANLLPPELCEILPSQPYRGKLSDEHTASMIQVSAKPPNVNATAITSQGLNELGFRQGATPLGAFGISIGTEMAVVPGRILPAPGIRYGHGTPAVDDRASWNLKNVKFAKGATLDNWVVLLIKDGNLRDEFSGVNDKELILTMKGFADMCSRSGMTVGKKAPAILAVNLPPKDRNDPIRAKAIQAVRTTLMNTRTKPTLVLVVLSNGDKHIYSGIKHLCDSYLDVGTVCVQASKIRKEKGQIQYFANVALKVNMKLGGINHQLDPTNVKWLVEKPTMLVGIDVTHPGPGSVKGTPSIAAVVASIDQYFAQYPASMEIQETKKEIVTNLAGMMHERLKLYEIRSKHLPDRILVYRDGVSEGQFFTVVEEELPAIKEAFKKFDRPNRPYKPKLTIVICGKRHHTRFYPTDAENADTNGNPKAGTIIDRGVTAVYHFDFFLQAHGGLQGTTRPTHYYVVHDEIGFKADALQGLTNAVSYMFARATKAVSLASPAYYADLACERGRCYLHKLLHGLSASGTSSASGSEEVAMREATTLWHNGVSGLALRDTMYYL